MRSQTQLKSGSQISEQHMKFTVDCAGHSSPMEDRSTTMEYHDEDRTEY
jgi:hypothetical protein